MTFTVTIGRVEDGVWVVECPAIPGCVGQGKTKDEALEKVKGAIKTCLEVRTEMGHSATFETQQVEVDDGVTSMGMGQQWREAVDRTFGLWKDRDDLPDFEEMRRGWDRSRRE